APRPGTLAVSMHMTPRPPDAFLQSNFSANLVGGWPGMVNVAAMVHLPTSASTVFLISGGGGGGGVAGDGDAGDDDGSVANANSGDNSTATAMSWRMETPGRAA